MHICMVMSTPFPPEEGIGNYVYGLSKQLIKEGHTVTIFTRGSRSQVNITRIDNITIVKPTFIPLYPFYIHLHGVMTNSVFKQMEDQFDLVHVHSPLCPLISTNLPMVATIHTPMLMDTKMRYHEAGDMHSKIEHLMGKTISYGFEKRLINRANKLTTVATSVAKELETYGLQFQSIDVIGNGVDEQVFIPDRTTNEKPTILFTGRIDYRKGLFDLIESSRMICNQCPDARFIITGKGLLLEKIKKQVQQLGLENNYEFTGFVQKKTLIQLYQKATLFVLPSHYEGLPTVLLEAMACGCPVVATSVSGNVDVIDDGINGLLVPPRSVHDLSEAILRVLHDTDLQSRLSKNARETIENRFTWKKIAKKYLDIYQSLTSE